MRRGNIEAPLPQELFPNVYHAIKSMDKKRGSAI
jgi:hypothetical protein